jgi:hypothetical protein
MDRNHFDMLMREILRHKHIKEQLEEENRELRRQLADLREARGICLDICGKRFVVSRAWTAPPALISYSTPAPTFLEEMMMDQSALPSTDFLSPEMTWPLSTKHKQSTKEDEQTALHGQLVDSFLLE